MPRKLKCLVVEDTAEINLAMTNAINDLKDYVEVTYSAHNAESALEICVNHTIDFILLDHGLAGLLGDGDKLLSNIRDRGLKVPYYMILSGRSDLAHKYNKFVGHIYLGYLLKDNILNVIQEVHTVIINLHIEVNRNNNDVTNNRIPIRTSKGLVFINCPDIIKALHANEITTIHYIDYNHNVQQIPIAIALTEMTQKLELLQINQNSSVNPFKIAKFEDNHVYLINDGNNKYEVKRTYLPEFKKRMGLP